MACPVSSGYRRAQRRLADVSNGGHLPAETIGRATAVAYGFNRPMQRIGEIPQAVHRSLVFFADGQ